MNIQEIVQNIIPDYKIKDKCWLCQSKVAHLFFHCNHRYLCSRCFIKNKENITHCLMKECKAPVIMRADQKAFFFEHACTDLERKINCILESDNHINVRDAFYTATVPRPKQVFSSDRCVICLSSKATLFFQCGHRCLCWGCHSELKLDIYLDRFSCPLCRELVKLVLWRV